MFSVSHDQLCYTHPPPRERAAGRARVGPLPALGDMSCCWGVTCSSSRAARLSLVMACPPFLTYVVTPMESGVHYLCQAQPLCTAFDARTAARPSPTRGCTL